MSTKRINQQKRKRDACGSSPRNNDLQPSHKRHKNNVDTQLASPPASLSITIASSGNLLNDETLFMHETETSECKDESDRESSADERVILDLSRTYQTPAKTINMFDEVESSNHSSDHNHNKHAHTSVISVSPSIRPTSKYSLSSSLSSPHSNDADAAHSPLLSSTSSTNTTMTRLCVRIDTISINALSVLYGYLSLDDTVQMSKTSRFFGEQSFRLLSRLRPVCKCIRGVHHKHVSAWLSRCSSYLKHLDLTNVAAVIDDDIVQIVSARCEQLTFVCLHGCQNITDAALMQLLSRCRWMRHLDISGLSQLTSAIAAPLTQCRKLQHLNMAWCSEVNGDIVAALVYLAHNHALRSVNLHGCNTFVTFYYAFQSVFKRLDERTQQLMMRTQQEHDKRMMMDVDNVESVRFRLQHELRLIGGLQLKTLNSAQFDDHLQDLQSRGIHFVDARSLGYASLSEYDHHYRLQLLLKSTQVSTAMYDTKVCKSGYRLYAVHNSDKIYMVIITEHGVFGTKLLPQKDFQGARDDFMATLQRSDRNPITFLKDECDLAHWNWLDVFQSRRCLALLGMHSNANWINITAFKYCPSINAFIDSRNKENSENNLNDAN